MHTTTYAHTHKPVCACIVYTHARAHTHTHAHAHAGMRQEESSLQSFRLADGSNDVRVVGDDDSDDSDDILHR